MVKTVFGYRFCDSVMASFDPGFHQSDVSVRKTDLLMLLPPLGSQGAVNHSLMSAPILPWSMGPLAPGDLVMSHPKDSFTLRHCVHWLIAQDGFVHVTTDIHKQSLRDMVLQWPGRKVTLKKGRLGRCSGVLLGPLVFPIEQSYYVHPHNWTESQHRCRIGMGTSLPLFNSSSL